MVITLPFILIDIDWNDYFVSIDVCCYCYGNIVHILSLCFCYYYCTIFMTTVQISYCSHKHKCCYDCQQYHHPVRSHHSFFFLLLTIPSCSWSASLRTAPSREWTPLFLILVSLTIRKFLHTFSTNSTINAHLQACCFSCCLHYNP